MIETTSNKKGKKLKKALKKAGYLYKCAFYKIQKEMLWLERPYADLFTMSELWCMLMDNINTDSGTIKLKAYKFNYGGNYLQSKFAYINEKGVGVKLSSGLNHCDALADLVIWCIENEYPLNLEKKEVSDDQ